MISLDLCNGEVLGLLIGDLSRYFKQSVHDVCYFTGQIFPFNWGRIAKVDSPLKSSQPIHHLLKFSFHVCCQMCVI